jgi:hypothetical protein
LAAPVASHRGRKQSSQYVILNGVKNLYATAGDASSLSMTSPDFYLCCQSGEKRQPNPKLQQSLQLLSDAHSSIRIQSLLDCHSQPTRRQKPPIF